MPDGAPHARDAEDAEELPGRAEVLDRIERALAGAGTGAFLAGPPGSGVTACLRTIATRLAAPDHDVRLAVGALDPRDLDGPVVVVDDAHGLGGPDADALRRWALTGGHRLVAGTTRPERCHPALRWLWTSGVLVRVDLTPLGRDAVAALVEQAAGAPPDGATVEAFLAASAGLPALLVLALDAAIAAGVLAERTGCARLSASPPLTPALTARIGSLLGALDPETAGALDLVCTAGRIRTPHHLLPDAALARLAAHALVRLEPDGDAHVARPAAGLVTRAVLDALGPAGQAALAARLLGTGGDPEPVRTRWRVRAGLGCGAPELLAAAWACRAAGETDDAEALARRAHDQGDTAAGILVAELLAARGDRRGAARTLESVLARPDTDPLARATATFELATLRLWNLADADGAVTLVRDAAPQLTPVIGAEPVVGAQASILVYSGRGAEALALVEGHVRTNGPTAEPLVDHVLAVARTLRGACEAACADARRGLARCLEHPGVPIPDPEIHVVGAAFALGEAGRLDEAETLVREWYERAVARGLHPGWLALARARVALQRGRLDVAARFGREAAAEFTERDNHAPRRWAVAAQLVAAAGTGDATACEALSVELDRLGTGAVRFLEPDVARAKAWALDAAGSTQRACDALAATARRAEDDGSPTLAAAAWHDALRMGRSEAAAHLVRLHDRVDGAWSARRAAHAEAFVRRDVDGLLAAADEFAAIGACLCAADAAAQAVALARRGGPGRAVRAATARALEHRAACGGAPSTPAVRALGAGVLSAREHEVARLAAGGRTSREIAAGLGVSVRTVDNLLQRAYTKLGIHRRSDLAEALARAERAGPGR